MLKETCNKIIEEIKNSISKLEEQQINIKTATEYIELTRMKNHFENLKDELKKGENNDAINEK